MLQSIWQWGGKGVWRGGRGWRNGPFTSSPTPSLQLYKAYNQTLFLVLLYNLRVHLNVFVLTVSMTEKLIKNSIFHHYSSFKREDFGHEPKDGKRWLQMNSCGPVLELYFCYSANNSVFKMIRYKKINEVKNWKQLFH